MAQGKRLSDLSQEAKRDIPKKLLARRQGTPETGGDDAAPGAGAPAERDLGAALDGIPESFYDFAKGPEYQQLHLFQAIADRAELESPYFKLHQGLAADTTVIGNEELINFASYNYLGLNGDPRVADAAKAAIDRYGVSASASRLVAGERPVHRDLEQALADLHGVDNAVVFVSGHATNVSAIGTLFGPRDLVLHDRLAHNSVIQGIRLSGAARQAFAHNDWRAVDAFLAEQRGRFEKVLIVVESLYGMDGDICPLPDFIEVKRRHKALLMVDEAHSIGVLGRHGRGIGEHFGIDGKDVDLWMGTLSKTLSACGGYIAGCDAVVELLKFKASGFVYSVGMPPANPEAKRRDSASDRQSQPSTQLHQPGPGIRQYPAHRWHRTDHQVRRRQAKPQAHAQHALHPATLSTRRRPAGRYGRRAGLPRTAFLATYRPRPAPFPGRSTARRATACWRRCARAPAGPSACPSRARSARPAAGWPPSPRRCPTRRGRFHARRGPQPRPVPPGR